jgi:hypothetical protein
MVKVKKKGRKERNRQVWEKSPCYKVFSNSAFEKGRVFFHEKVPVFILANGMDNLISNFA